MTTEFVAYVALCLSVFGNIALFLHGRRTRRALLAHLQGMENRANRLINPDHRDYSRWRAG